MASALETAVRPPPSKAKHAPVHDGGVAALRGEARVAAEAWVAFVFEAAGSGSGKRLLRTEPPVGRACLSNGIGREAAAAAAGMPLVSEESKEALRVEAKKDHYEQLCRLNGSEVAPSTLLHGCGVDSPTSSSSLSSSLQQRVPRLYTYSELQDLDGRIRVEERIHAARRRRIEKQKRW